MGAMNRVILMGNLTRDPEVRHTTTGLAVSDLGIAVSEKYKAKDGQMAERTCFADIVAWGKTAENCGQFLSKGRQVLVEGSLQLDQWQTDKGEKRSRLKVRAERIQFLGAPGGRRTSGDATALAPSRSSTGGSVKSTEPVEAAPEDNMPF